MLCLIAELFLSIILPTGLSGNYIDSAIIPHILKTYFETFIDVPKPGDCEGVQAVGENPLPTQALLSGG